MNDWKTWETTFKEEEEERINTDFSQLCNYGIPALDNPLLAIAKNELVVIGADSGVGKSDLALHFARHNALNNKKIALFYLEGGHLEAMRRMKFRDMKDIYYKNRQEHEYREMDFRRWALNCGDNMTDLSAKVYEQQKELYKNLFFYPISEGLRIEDVLGSLLSFHKLKPVKYGEFEKEGVYDLDLIIIDHLQYFSLDKEDNEISEITKIIRECKKITDHHHIPIVLISHLRKKSKDRGLPDQEDFYGSSNIPKISTTSITIAPDTHEDNLSTNIYPTFFRIVKSRVGIRPNYAMRCNYDLNLREYAKEYQIFKLDGMGNVLIPPLTEDKYPHWAKTKGV